METHHRVLKLLRLLEAAPLPGIRNLHPAYNSLLIVFDPLIVDHAALQRTLDESLHRLDTVVLPEPCSRRNSGLLLEANAGPDSTELAAMHSMPPERVIEIHSSARYLVYFVGFVPGFAYLGGMPPELATPRLQTPRKRVPRGSVAIGGTHTGVYPFETPGGWRLIGKTPLEIFDPSSAKLSRLRIGDVVRFRPVPA